MLEVKGEWSNTKTLKEKARKIYIYITALELENRFTRTTDVGVKLVFTTQAKCFTCG